MGQIIGGVYEIIGQIGAGGGGVVYLAKHLRLEKNVVLKADRRTLSAKPETLRREVDALKNLSHTYIPQVYDFVVEDGMIYTVMDYIEGESLDKPLKRGVRFNQPQVIGWALQLLDALVYLHSRPPHGMLHADIKPANLMLTRQGDIRLIDFNIALALGESGAIAVGRSFGYASPEHYSVDVQVRPVATATQETTVLTSQLNQETVAVTEGMDEALPSGSSISLGADPIFLDARSDIYSVGATLYHLLTGIRPAKEAVNVTPMTDSGVSPALKHIIEKAMASDPDFRYQTAEEMRAAFLSLWTDDPRVRRQKRTAKIIFGLLAVTLVAGIAMTGYGSYAKNQAQSWEIEAHMETITDQGNTIDAQGNAINELDSQVSAGSSSANLDNGNLEAALNDAVDAIESSLTPAAQKALSDALGIYNLSDGYQPYRTVELDTQTMGLAISPDGALGASFAGFEITVFNCKTEEILAILPTLDSGLVEMVFVDETTLLYGGAEGLTAYDCNAQSQLWQGQPATAIQVSGDGSTVATICRDAQEILVYSMDGTQTATISMEGRNQWVPANDRLGNAGTNLFTINHTGTMVAVSLDGGGLMIYDLTTSDGDMELFDYSDYTQFSGGFYDQYFAFSASMDGESLFGILDVEAMAMTGSMQTTTPMGVVTDETGIYLSNENIIVSIHPTTGEQTEVAYTGESDVACFARSGGNTLVITQDGGYSVFDHTAQLLSKRVDTQDTCQYGVIAGEYAIVGGLDFANAKILKSANHQDATIMTYDPAYAHDEARLTVDGKFAMLFSYAGFRIYDQSGTEVVTVDMPNAAEIYDQQYTRDGTNGQLEVTYNDGEIMIYAGETGELLETKQGETPDLTLYEEFFTDDYRIEAPLHGAPTVYDLETGELVKTLESNAYLTYVTQLDGYIMTEYISVDGSRYGLLLDENCETVAQCPELCDILGDRLIYDTTKGELRETRIYTLDELVTLGKEQLALQ